MNKTIPDKFAPLFVPNWSKGERQKFTPEFKENLRSRLLAGEELAAVDPVKQLTTSWLVYLIFLIPNRAIFGIAVRKKIL